MQNETIPSAMAVVALHAGEASHWRRTDEGDIAVSVVTSSSGTPMWCLLHAAGGGGVGVWCIPPIGAEGVAVFPDGDFEGDPVFYGGGQAPEQLDGATIVIVAPAGGKVLIVDAGGGTPKSLVTKDEHEAHTHPAPALSGTTTYAVGNDPIARTGTPPAVAGTNVLEAM